MTVGKVFFSFYYRINQLIADKQTRPSKPKLLWRSFYDNFIANFVPQVFPNDSINWWVLWTLYACLQTFEGFMYLGGGLCTLQHST